jgi:TPR repeat protein
MTNSFIHANTQLTPKHLPAIERGAKKGNVTQMYQYGLAFLLGGLVEKDYGRAYFWLAKAARAGHADAAFRCGFILTHKYLTPDTGEEDAYWYSIAEKNGSDAGRCALANQWTLKKLAAQKWWNKWFSRSDFSEEAVSAYRRYEIAHKNEYSIGTYFLGIHTLKGWGCEPSLVKARELFKDGVNASDRDSALALALTYKVRDPEYIIYLEKAADLGNPQAQYRMAVLLLAKRTKEASEHAVMWLKRAGMQSFPQAYLLLATMYRGGYQIESSPYQAYIWMRRAVHYGAASPRVLGLLYSKLTDDEKTKVDNFQDKDDAEYHRMSKELFSNPMLPVVTH